MKPLKRLYNMLLLLHLSTRINPGVNDIALIFTHRRSLPEGGLLRNLIFRGISLN